MHIANHLLCNLCFVAHSSHVEDLTECHIFRASSEFISLTSHNPVKRCVFNVSAFELSLCQLYFVSLCWFSYRIFSYRKNCKKSRIVNFPFDFDLDLANCSGAGAAPIRKRYAYFFYRNRPWFPYDYGRSLCERAND